MSYELQDFERQVLRRSHEVPVVVDFWAPWCGPCKMLGPVIEKLAAAAGGRWDLVKIDTERHQDLAASFEVSSIPSVKLFRHGKIADEFLGFRSEKDIQDWLAPHLGASTDAEPSLLERAAEHIDDGDLALARQLLEDELVRDPQCAAAKLLLAETLLGTDEPKAIALLDGIPADANERAHAMALRILAQAAARTDSSIPEDPLRPRLLAGLAAIRARDWDGALEALVEVVERRPRLADGVAPEAGKAIFRYLGIRHPIADKHYRRFSSALNA